MLIEYTLINMENKYSITVDDIYTALVNNGDIPKSDDETVKAVQKSMIGADINEFKRGIYRILSPSYTLLSELIDEKNKELEEQSDTLSDREKLKKQVDIYVMYRYQSMIAELCTT